MSDEIVITGPADPYERGKAIREHAALVQRGLSGAQIAAIEGDPRAGQPTPTPYQALPAASPVPMNSNLIYLAELEREARQMAAEGARAGQLDIQRAGQLAREFMPLVPRALVDAHNRALIKVQEAEANLQQARRQQQAATPTLPIDPALVPEWVKLALSDEERGNALYVQAYGNILDAAQREAAAAQERINEALRGIIASQRAQAERDVATAQATGEQRVREAREALDKAMREATEGVALAQQRLLRFGPS